MVVVVAEVETIQGSNHSRHSTVSLMSKCWLIHLSLATISQMLVWMWKMQMGGRCVQMWGGGCGHLEGSMVMGGRVGVFGDDSGE